MRLAFLDIEMAQVVRIFPHGRQGHIFICQYHGYWSGDARCQGTNNNDIDLVIQELFVLDEATSMSCLLCSLTCCTELLFPKWSFLHGVLNIPDTRSYLFGDDLPPVIGRSSAAMILTFKLMFLASLWKDFCQRNTRYTLIYLQKTKKTFQPSRNERPLHKRLELTIQ